MSMSISNFKSNFVSGARPNLYRVEITYLGGNLAFTCKAASLPPSNVEQIEVPFMGRSLKVAGNRTFQDWTVTVLNDTHFEVRHNCEKWMGEINLHEANTGASEISAYMKDAKVEQLDQTGNPIYTYEFKDIWPSEVSEISLGYEENNSIEEFTITFAIGSYWQSDAVE